MTYKLAFVGTHSTGKTTAMNELIQRLNSYGVTTEVVTEVARTAHERGMPLNQDTTKHTQRWIASTQIGRECVAESKDPDVVVCDRSVLDSWAYQLVVNGPDSHICSFVTNWLPTYDALVSKEPREAVTDDGIRPTDEDFRMEVHHQIQALLNSALTRSNDVVQYRDVGIEGLIQKCPEKISAGENI